MVDPKVMSLIKVVEMGSYTKAAESLSLSQPAVSQHIRALEEELEVKLFERVRGESHLTKEGEIVMNYARRLLSLENNLLQALKSEKRQISSLTVGITHTAESNAIVEALAVYVNHEIGMTIKILTDRADNLYTMLKNYEIDFAIVEGRTGGAAFNYMLLDTDYLVLAVPPGHKLADREQITIEELKKEKLIFRLPKSGTRTLFSAALEVNHLTIDDFNIILEIDNIATIKDLIRRDFGVSVLAKSACMDEIGKNKLMALSIENFSMSREINLVYTNDFAHPDLLEQLVRTYHEMRG